MVDVIAAVRSFFDTWKLLSEVNATISALAPKKVNRILANRILPCLDGIINLNQSAIIPNRSIAENVLLAQEVLKKYHKN